MRQNKVIHLSQHFVVVVLLFTETSQSHKLVSGACVLAVRCLHTVTYSSQN